MNLSQEEFSKMFGGPAHFLLVDIRESEERLHGYIEPSLHVPLNQLEEKIFALTKNTSQKLILYCAHGLRSQSGVKILNQLGFTDVHSLSGGYEAWKKPHNNSPRYLRHYLLPQVGQGGQEKLAKAKVALVGMGGLGCPVSQYLTAAGVGTLGLIDHDTIDLSNLQRQILYSENDLGKLKVDIAQEKLSQLNSHIKFFIHPEKLAEKNAREILKNYDLVVNGSDNFPTRYLINQICLDLKKPWVDGAIQQFEGQLSVFIPAIHNPCYRCLYPEAPENPQNCADAGVLGVLPGIMGNLQALEVIKLILGIGECASGRLLIFDGLSLRFREIQFKKDPHCPACGSSSLTLPL